MKVWAYAVAVALLAILAFRLLPGLFHLFEAVIR